MLLFHLTIEFYLSDIRKLVDTSVNADIARLEATGDPGDHQDAKNRRRDLNAWLRQDYPFSYENYLTLCRIINPRATTLPSSNHKLNQTAFLESLASPVTRRNINSPPFIRGGSFQHIQPIAIDRLKDFAERIHVDVKAY